MPNANRPDKRRKTSSKKKRVERTKHWQATGIGKNEKLATYKREREREK